MKKTMFLLAILTLTTGFCFGQNAFVEILKNNRDTLIPSGIMSFIGLIFVIFAASMILRSIKLKKLCKESISAAVVGYEARTHRRSKGRGSYTLLYPVVSYKVNGQDFVHNCSSGFSYKKYPEGENIPLFYNINNPNQCYAKYEMTAGQSIVFPLIMGVFGTLPLVLGISGIIKVFLK